MKALGFEISFAEGEKFFRSWAFQLVCLAGTILFGLMAFGPQDIVHRLQLDGARKWLGPWLGILFVMSSVFVLGIIWHNWWQKFQTARSYKGKNADARISRLSPAARVYFGELFLCVERGGQYRDSDPVFLELQDAEIVRTFIPENASFVSCYLRQWAVEWINKHPEILGEYERNRTKSDQDSSYVHIYKY